MQALRQVENSTPKGRPKKRQKVQADVNEEDKWLALIEQQNQMMRESQQREEQLFARLEKSERNRKDLIVGAIRELGSLLEKD